MLLDGKVGIVTGAASGMGRAAALLFAGQGARVVCADIKLDRAEEVVAQLGTVGMARLLDLSDRESCRAVVSSAIQKYGRVDFVTNFGGVWDGRNTAEIEDEHWDRVLDVNLKGAFLICQAVAPFMMKQNCGRIVLIGSIGARVGGEMGGPHYAASKGGVMSLARALARRLAPHKVTVNTINPGPVESEMTASWSEEVKATMAKTTPLGRIGQPVDIARVALFLVSDLSAWMTGQTLEVNGGLYFAQHVTGIGITHDLSESIQDLFAIAKKAAPDASAHSPGAPVVPRSGSRTAFGTRTVVKYVLSPVQKDLPRGWRER